MGQMTPAHMCYRSLKYLASSSEIHLKPTTDRFSLNIRSLFHRATCVNPHTSTQYFGRSEPNRQCERASVGGMCGPPWSCRHSRRVSSCGACGHVLLRGDNDRRKLASHFKQPAPRQLMQISLWPCSAVLRGHLFFSNFPILYYATESNYCFCTHIP